MTNRALILWVALASLGAARCSGDSTQPCTACPNVAGTWAMNVNASTGTVSASCATLGIGQPTGPLLVSQTAAALSGTFAGFGLTGTLYDTHVFTLSGFGSDGGASSSDSLSVHAQYVPSLNDAGAYLTGNLNATYQRSSQGSAVNCTQFLPFTATAP